MAVIITDTCISYDACLDEGTTSEEVPGSEEDW